MRSFNSGHLTVEHLDGTNNIGTRNLYMIRGFNTTTNKEDPFVKRYGQASEHCTVLFQSGDPSLVGRNGVTMEALLSIVADRLEGYQSGPYACTENQRALEGVQDAIKALEQRQQRLK